MKIECDPNNVPLGHFYSKYSTKWFQGLSRRAKD